MIYLPGLVGFLLVLTAEARIGSSSNASYCTETEQCLLPDEICKTDDCYEVRRYGSVKWVSTDEESYFMMWAAMRSFRRLFGYINGDNKDGKKIQMTSPVIIKMKNPNKTFWQIGEYTMSFLLPAEDQTNPPLPDDKKVYIDEKPDMKVFVKSYGGWITTSSDKENAKLLASCLKPTNAKYKKDYHYTVGYNSPMTMLDRHNEVWFVADGEPSCSRED